MTSIWINMKKRKETDKKCKSCKNRKLILVLENDIQYYRCDFCGEIYRLEDIK